MSNGERYPQHIATIDTGNRVTVLWHNHCTTLGKYGCSDTMGFIHSKEELREHLLIEVENIINNVDDKLYEEEVDK